VLDEVELHAWVTVPVGRKNSIRIPPTAREAELDQAALPVNTFAENSRLYSPAMARLTPLTMVETGVAIVLQLSVLCALPDPSPVPAASATAAQGPKRDAPLPTPPRAGPHPARCIVFVPQGGMDAGRCFRRRG
jgi:hypothetical protein